MPENWTHIPPESVAHLPPESVAHYSPESVAHFDRNTRLECPILLGFSAVNKYG